MAIASAGLFFGYDAVTSQVTSSLKDMLGDTGANAIDAMLAGASRPAEGILATVLGVGALLFAAIEFYLHGSAVAVLRILDQENHKEGDRKFSSD
ncbi:hypothetical protein BLN97_32250 [Bradyrhizobium elkanii]|nr:hypothetical protein BLN97_32250 [Bradyrhizobium elkanii]